MRRALLKQWPAFTRFYGFRPWDIELFTPDELNEYVKQMNDYQRAEEAAQRRG